GSSGGRLAAWPAAHAQAPREAYRPAFPPADTIRGRSERSRDATVEVQAPPLPTTSQEEAEAQSNVGWCPDPAVDVLRGHRHRAQLSGPGPRNPQPGHEPLPVRGARADRGRLRRGNPVALRKDRIASGLAYAPGYARTFPHVGISVARGN